MLTALKLLVDTLLMLPKIVDDTRKTTNASEAAKTLRRMLTRARSFASSATRKAILHVLVLLVEVEMAAAVEAVAADHIVAVDAMVAVDVGAKAEVAVSTKQ